MTDNKGKLKATITLAAENVAETGINKCYYITNQSQFVLGEKSNKKAPKRSIQAKFKDNLSGRGTRTRTLGTWFWSKRTDFQKANKINKLTTIATKTADYSTTAEPNFEKQILQL